MYWFLTSELTWFGGGTVDHSRICVCRWNLVCRFLASVEILKYCWPRRDCQNGYKDWDGQVLSGRPYLTHSYPERPGGISVCLVISFDFLMIPSIARHTHRCKRVWFFNVHRYKQRLLLLREHVYEATVPVSSGRRRGRNSE